MKVDSLHSAICKDLNLHFSQFKIEKDNFMERFLRDVIYPTQNLLLGKTVRQITKEMCQMSFPDRPPIVRLCIFNVSTVCKLIRSFRELAVVLLCPIRDPPLPDLIYWALKSHWLSVGILLFPFDCSKDNDIVVLSSFDCLKLTPLQ